MSVKFQNLNQSILFVFFFFVSPLPKACRIYIFSSKNQHRMLIIVVWVDSYHRLHPRGDGSGRIRTQEGRIPCECSLINASFRVPIYQYTDTNPVVVYMVYMHDVM